MAPGHKYCWRSNRPNSKFIKEGKHRANMDGNRLGRNSSRSCWLWWRGQERQLFIPSDALSASNKNWDFFRLKAQQVLEDRERWGSFYLRVSSQPVLSGGRCHRSGQLDSERHLQIRYKHNFYCFKDNCINTGLSG